jgi:hypothetical protein
MFVAGAEGKLFMYGSCNDGAGGFDRSQCTAIDDTWTSAIATPTLLPMPASDGGSPFVTAVAAATHHTAVIADGSVWTMGICSLGALGRPCVGDSGVPMAIGVVPGITDAVAVTAAGDLTAVVAGTTCCILTPSRWLLAW